ncbi:hypothetical protein GALMADRAFT_76823 [Galerina marginata CBS 339.88]|uniref:BTB domain-containing protein n=1 Tax=Galerina marginata (strain CBS 339.88) TaxID=685588 RepID=A0A067SQV0_GALM3|nr:hypothetical protein GALMADRAFT_76823 [Galerina marginata CBS 339.88]
MVKEKLPPEKYANLVRSDFWFRDGNIVIIAGSAAFKVHRGQLERHSEVFSDLFSLPQPSDQELVDGCSSVELQDPPSDVFYFLSALYDGLYFKRPRSSNFPAIAAVLRLSSKYLVEHLRQRCLARLDTDWPSKLIEWDSRERRSTDENGRYAPRDHCAHPILVIELALDMNLPTILPAALYDLSRYGPSKIMVGTTSPTSAFDRIISQLTASPLPPERPVRLSRDLLCRTLRGREATQRYMAGFIAKELHCRAPATDCLNSAEKESSSRPCHESFYFIMLNILRSVGGIACGRDADPLYTLIQAADMLTRTDFSDGQRQCGLKLCQTCKVDFAEATSKAREEVWSLLPQWFGFVDSEKCDSVLDLD